MVSIVQACRVAELMWPEFESEGSAVFLRALRQHAPQPLSSFSDIVEAEAFVNHVHVLDVFENNAELPQAPFWNGAHQDFESALRLAAVIAECWAAKLSRDFPERPFAIFATRDDNPVVRFHSIVPNTALWLEPPSENDGSVLCIIVSTEGIARRHGSLASSRFVGQDASSSSLRADFPPPPKLGR